MSPMQRTFLVYAVPTNLLLYIKCQFLQSIPTGTDGRYNVHDAMTTSFYFCVFKSLLNNFETTSNGAYVEVGIFCCWKILLNTGPKGLLNTGVRTKRFVKYRPNDDLLSEVRKFLPSSCKEAAPPIPPSPALGDIPWWFLWWRQRHLYSLSHYPLPLGDIPWWFLWWRQRRLYSLSHHPFPDGGAGLPCPCQRPLP